MVLNDGWFLPSGYFWQGLQTFLSPKGNSLWILIGRTEAEAPILWPSDRKSQLTEKDPDADKDWGQEEKGVADEMVGWHHRLNGHEFEPTLGDGEGQGSLACCSPCNGNEWDTTERLKSNSNRHFWLSQPEVTLVQPRDAAKHPTEHWPDPHHREVITLKGQ